MTEIINISRLDEIDFENDVILSIIDDLEILQDLFVVSQKEYNKQVTLLVEYDFDTVLISLGIYLQELIDTRNYNELKFYETNSILLIQSIYKNGLELNYDKFNQKYSDFLFALIADFGFENMLTGELSILRRNSNKYKTGKAKNQYEVLKGIFHSFYSSRNISQLIDQYCFDQNITIKKLKDNTFKIFYTNRESAIFDNKNGQKYQYLMNFYRCCGNDLYEELHGEGFNGRARPLQPSQIIFQAVQQQIYADIYFFREHGFEDIFQVNGCSIKTSEVITFLEMTFGNSQSSYDAILFKYSNENTFIKLAILLAENYIFSGVTNSPIRIYTIPELIQNINSTLSNSLNHSEQIIDFCTNDFQKSTESTKAPFIRIGNNIIMFEPITINMPFMFVAYDLFIENKLNNPKYFEWELIDKFKMHKFSVLEHGSRELDGIDFDLLAYKDSTLFIGEIKSTYFRKTKGDIYKHLFESITHANFQLDVRKDYMQNNWGKVCKVLNIGNIPFEQLKIKTIIISTTFETDYQYFGDHQGISFFELYNILDNQKQMFFRPDAQILSTANRNNGQFIEQWIPTQLQAFIEDPEFVRWNMERLGINNDSIIEKIEKGILYPIGSKLSGTQLLDYIENYLFWNFITINDVNISEELYHFIPKYSNCEHYKISQRAKAFYKRHDYVTALSLFKNADHQFPFSSEYKFYVGLCYKEIGKLNDALKYLLQAEEIDKENGKEDANCLANISIIYSSIGNYDLALSYTNRALKLELSFDLILQKINLLFNYKLYSEAFECFYDIIKYLYDISIELPDLNEVYDTFLSKLLPLENKTYRELFALGSICFMKKDYIKAIQYLEEAKLLTIDRGDIYHCLSLAHEFINQLAKATELEYRAIEFNPISSVYYDRLGHLFLKDNNFDLALAHFNKAIALNPQFSQAYSNRAVAYRKNENYLEAIADNWKAIEITPTLTAAFKNLIWIYKKLDRPKSAHFTGIFAPQSGNIDIGL